MKTFFYTNLPIYTIVLFIFFISLPGSSQTTYNYPHKPNKQYLKSYLTISKNIITGPAKWNRTEWIIAGSAIATGTICYIYDEQIRDFFQNHQNKTADNISEYIFNPWGGVTYPAILLGGFYLYGVSTNNSKPRQVALAGTQAFIMSAITTEILKNIFHRHRPCDDIPANPRKWDGPFKGWEYTSFPSRHAAIAFSLATVISDAYADKIWVSALSYSLATGVAISRVYDDEHWTSDVIIGATLGYAIGKSVSSLLKNNDHLSINVSSNGGIVLNYKL